MNEYRRDFLQRSLALAAAATHLTVAATAVSASSSASAAARDGRADFDFFVGHWSVSARRLRNRLAQNQSWESVTGTTRVIRILQGAGNLDEDEFQLPGQSYVGGMLRLYDAQRDLWSTYGLDRDSGVLQPPQQGRFAGSRGEFYGDDQSNGRPVKVRHVYTKLTPTTCRWEQAFSIDAGKAWETNWVIDFARLP
jgi:hypothetical protein